uniref:Uncharacterized protein n=1 Tax=Molossus molossus TaxID=27622 RepID=A0A7J8I9T5_MOLMO|nr:hypothetical protein HJG59_010719 [Molossus molossus]
MPLHAGTDRDAPPHGHRPRCPPTRAQTAMPLHAGTDVASPHAGTDRDAPPHAGTDCDAPPHMGTDAAPLCSHLPMTSFPAVVGPPASLQLLLCPPTCRPPGGAAGRGLPMALPTGLRCPKAGPDPGSAPQLPARSSCLGSWFFPAVCRPQGGTEELSPGTRSLSLSLFLGCKLPGT